MNSEDINKDIIEIDGHGCNDDPVYRSCIGEKIIPYIGWFWRTVDFDSDSCYLGILPILQDEDGIGESNDELKVGFMEKNKWFYDEFEVKGPQWETLKELIVNAIEKKDADSFRAVDSYMQSLLPAKYR